MERDRFTRALLELPDPPMSEASVASLTCHLHEPALVVVLSSKKKVLTEKERLKLTISKEDRSSVFCMLYLGKK